MRQALLAVTILPRGFATSGTLHWSILLSDGAWPHRDASYELAGQLFVERMVQPMLRTTVAEVQPLDLLNREVPINRMFPGQSLATARTGKK